MSSFLEIDTEDSGFIGTVDGAGIVEKYDILTTDF